jgi:hypothetical protein
MQLEPFGEERADFRIAQLCALVETAVTGKKTKPSKYMLDFDKAREKKKPEDMLPVFRAMTAAHNAMKKGKYGNNSQPGSQLDGKNQRLRPQD